MIIILIDELIKEETLPENQYLARHGFVHSLLLEKDLRFEKIKNELRVKMEDEKFLKEIKELIHVKLRKTISGYQERLKSQPSDYIADDYIKSATSDIQYLLNNTLIEYGDYIFNKYFARDIETSNYSYIKENYIYYIIITELVECRKLEVAQSIDHDKLIFDLYKESSIDLNESDEQYNKYSLISIKPNWLKYNTADAYVYDPRINKTFVQLHVPTDVSKFFIDLTQNKQLNALAVRADGKSFQDGEKRISCLNEDVQFGKVFSLEGFRNIRITKLYSVKLKDSLWVAVDDENITFEEMLEDFQVTDNDEVKTQVVHLEYKVDGEQVLITHIDHEYIYYTFDEYMKRTEDFKQKGQARKRVKTFKIDQSAIPFVLDDGTSLLYTVLKSFFKNQDLIDEYFMNVLDTSEEFNEGEVVLSTN